MKRTGNDCSLCKSDPELRKQWGCDKPHPKGFKYDMGGVVLERCPLALIRQPWVQQALSLYAHYKRGITPNNAGLRGETAFYRRCMIEVANNEAAAEAWYNEQLNKKRKRGR